MKRKRLKTSSGIVASFGYGQTLEGKYKIMSCGSLRVGRNPMPTAFAPFEFGNAVYNSPLFNTEKEVIAFIERI